MSKDEMIKAVTQLHDEVDQLMVPLVERHGERLNCALGCSGCCQDHLTVFEVEADRIRATVGDRLAGAIPRSAGKCAFLDEEGSCRIYEARPYVCRTQGLPLRWIDQSSGEEQRGICPLNGTADDLRDIASDDCWTIGPVEGRLAGLQVEMQHGEGFVPPRRIALRALFTEMAAGGS